MILVKTETMNLGPVKVEKVLEDKNLVAIELSFDGRKYRISKGESYSHSLRIHEQVTHLEEERWVVEGEFNDIKVFKTFETEYAAKSYREDWPSSSNLVVSKKKVKVSIDSSSEPDMPF